MNLTALLGPFATHVEKQEAGRRSGGRRMLDTPTAAPTTVALDVSPVAAILIGIFILIWDFFLGFYTGYLRGFFT